VYQANTIDQLCGAGAPHCGVANYRDASGRKNKTAGFIDLSVEESGDFFRQRR
jgi:hypothetical protein